MFKKGQKLYSITHQKCPHCHEGDFFEGSFFKAEVKERCPVCDSPYTKEVGFYQGSYYVVYALGVAVFVAIWVFIELFLPWVGFDGILYAVLTALIISAPFIYPLSKIIWANFFFHYNFGKTEKTHGETVKGEL
ncbi:MAG: DUF983 domain-containing protein [Bacteroidetes bacterium]|nr:MAG: DUF983 domain-containing protein [Bacteroidota bacterium]